VLGFGARVTVVAPAELRERVVRAAREIVALYDGAELTGAADGRRGAAG
jgi:hypothetical protein